MVDVITPKITASVRIARKYVRQRCTISNLNSREIRIMNIIFYNKIFIGYNIFNYLIEINEEKLLGQFQFRSITFEIEISYSLF